MIKSKLYTIFILTIYLHLNTSCQEEFVNEVVVYENDFSTTDLMNFTTDQEVQSFGNDMVLGFFNNESFSFRMDQLPSHNYLRITLEIFIHDSWDGNASGVDGPDQWFLFVNEEMIVNTSFSNSVCVSTYCLYQSYPENGLRQLNPKSGATALDFPGRCQYEGVNGWTTKYTISNVIAHKTGTLNIIAKDELRQLNRNDPKCDESWSLNKLTVSTINTN